ncbi:MAG: multi-sensor signal transduction histidine kinase [Rubritepida sp.]|nr:multi-sensor signal transduction histidine kinase [Rubritepida sp.]
MTARIGATVIALATFFVDTFTTTEVAIAVMYGAVVLLAVDFATWQRVLLVGIACIVATLGSFLATHGLDTSGGELARCIVSLSAIGVTTLLAVRMKATMLTLHEQAQLLDLTHDTVFVRDAADHITFWNRGAEVLYGWPREAALGQDTHKLLQTEFPAPLPSIMAELRRTGRWEGELMHRRRDGSQVIVASRWSLQERGSSFAVLETNTDITAHRHAESQTRQAQASLAHVSRVATMGELTASIAHEVNQPLAAIVAHGEAALRWLNRPVPELEEVRLGLERIIGDGRRAADVIQRLRALARKDEPQRVPLDLREVIRGILPLVQPEIRHHRVALRLELPELPAVIGDKVQLQQVIINLVMNGIQAMALVADKPRALTIEVHEEAGEHPGERIVIEVSDTGPGIAADKLDQLFEAFYSTKPDGMGIGLSICRSIIAAHGGRIWASAREGGGASFHIALPVAGSGA